MTRRALLALCAALLPAFAAAQAAGQVIGFPDNLLSKSECTSAAAFQLDWTIQPYSGVTFAPTGSIHAYASNKAVPTTGTGANVCFTQPDSSQGVTAAEVGTANPTFATQSESFPADKFVTGAGFACTDTSDHQIFVCVQWFDANGNKAGFATGTLTFSVATPPTPTGLTVTPGDMALNVSWHEDTTATVNADKFRVEAKTTDPRDPTGTHSALTNATSYRIGGLVNSVQYEVRVFAQSTAGNESSPAGPVLGTPLPVADFWDLYKAANGPEEGGCASGSAGALALLGTAALVALRRRKP